MGGDSDESREAGIGAELAGGLSHGWTHRAAGLFPVAPVRLAQVAKDPLEGLQLTPLAVGRGIGDITRAAPASARSLLENQAGIENSLDYTIREIIGTLCGLGVMGI